MRGKGERALDLELGVVEGVISENSGFTRSTRDRAVVKSLVQGHTNKEIAHQHGITEQTVKDHIQRLMRKPKTATRMGLLARLLLKGDRVGIIGSVIASFC